MAHDIKIVREEDGIAILTWDLADRAVNVFSEATISAFETAIRTVIADETIVGCIIASSKDVFHVGADLEMAQRLADLPVEALFARISALNGLFRAMETGGTIFAAAIEGHALGGGLEMALACHARIVADDDRIRLGLPEVRLGLMPGFGGTQRLPRLLNLTEAMTALGTGKAYRPKKAVSIGLATELALRGETIERAKEWIRANPKARQPWDRKGTNPPGGVIHSAENLPILAAAAAQVRKNSYDNYPAPPAILSAVYHGLQLPIDQALELETRAFVRIARTDVAQNMMETLFFGMNAANNLQDRPDIDHSFQFERIGIVGAGLMGSGIGSQASRQGMDVVIVDRDIETAEKGRNYSEAVLRKSLKRGHIDETQLHAHLKRIDVAANYDALRDCDLVIEAIFEDSALKQVALRKIADVVRVDCIIASNTSTIPITQLSGAVDNPERFIGLHFFSPVEQMPLLEIISGELTDEATLAAAFDFSKVMGKTPIAVNDGRAFFTTRVVSSYMTEGMVLLEEGVLPALIENAGTSAGMPMGPLRLTDMVNLDLAVSISDQARTDLGDDFVEPPGIAVAKHMVALGRRGEKTGMGFYDHASADPKLWQSLAEEFPPATIQPPLEEIVDRLIMVQMVETLRCFQDGVLKAARDADLGSILGWGFAPHTGGIARAIDAIGADTLLDRLKSMTQAYGDRFAPPDYLHQLSKSGGSLHAT